MHRRGFPAEDVAIINEIYRILYLSDLNVSNAVKLIMETVPESIYRDEIVDFVNNSTRGIIRSAI